MYGKMQEPRLTFHIHRLSGASIMFLLSAHHREWLRPKSCRMVGVLLLPGCPGRLELLMIMTGNTPFLSWEFPHVLEVKNPPANAGDGGSILDLGRSHRPQGK